MSQTQKPIKISAKDYLDSAKEDIVSEVGINNPFLLPQITKVSINTGVGHYEKANQQIIADYITSITGQTPHFIKAKESIAAFKIRKGDISGVALTLRGEKMYNFLLQLIYIALPNTRDFKGIKKTSFNKEKTCYSLGIKSATIFPSVGFDAKVNFGMQINITFKDSNEHNSLFLDKLNFPFHK